LERRGNLGLPELVGHPAGLPNFSLPESEADHDGDGSPGHCDALPSR